MSIRKVLLPVSTDADIAPLAAMAFSIGQQFSARVEGVFAQSAYLNVPILGESVDPRTINQMIERVRAEHAENATKAQAAFDRLAQRHKKVEATFVSEEGSLDAIFTRRARLADISVVGSVSRYDDTYWRSARESVLFRSGRPVMVAPASGGATYKLDKVLIAWKEGIEAARAVAAAQPFLNKASEVHLVTIGEDEDAVASLNDVEDYLQLHYAEVRSEVVPFGSRNASEVLQDKAESLGGLLVMGAYSHAPWRERVFGGVTDHMLRHATIPVLMTH